MTDYPLVDIRKSSTTTPTTSPVVQSPPPESGTSGSSAPYTPPRGVPAGDSLTPLLEELQRHTRKVEEMMKKPDDITAHSNLPFKWQRKRKKDSMDVDGSQDVRIFWCRSTSQLTILLSPGSRYEEGQRDVTKSRVCAGDGAHILLQSIKHCFSYSLTERLEMTLVNFQAVLRVS